MDPKKPWLSKTLWVNLTIASLAFFPSASHFVAVNPEVTVAVFGAVNFILRLVTKSGVSLQD